MTTKTFHLKIVTPEGVAYEDDVYQITVQTTSGEITILPEHIHLISIVKAGEMRIKDAEGMHPYALTGGILEVRKKGYSVIILADTAERAEEIDVERAIAARERAEELLAQADIAADIDFARFNAIINKEMNRIKIGTKYRKLR